MKIESKTILALLVAASLSACAHAPAPDVAVAPGLQSATPSSVADAEKQRQFESLLDAAKQGDLDAQFVLAQAYEVGNGIEMNLDQAFYWYGKAANAGYVPAQFYFGAMYASSRGTPLDVAKAIYWFRKAADQGYPDALYPVAYAYEFGLGGLQQDNEQALAWYRKAADAGNPFAFLRLAKAYRSGELGLTIDAGQARLFEEKQQAASGGKLMSMPVGKQ